MAVVIENSLYPRPAHRAVRTIGDDGRILDGDADLIVEAIGDPTADLHRVAPPEAIKTLKG